MADFHFLSALAHGADFGGAAEAAHDIDGAFSVHAATRRYLQLGILVATSQTPDRGSSGRITSSHLNQGTTL